MTFISGQEKTKRLTPPSVSLRIEVQDPNRAQITGVDLIPSRGMNLSQLFAHVPGKGTIKLLLAAPESSSEDWDGNFSFKYGGAFLVPFANRIRGKLLNNFIHTNVGGKTVDLPANWAGKKAGADRVAMHGLILQSVFQVEKIETGSSRARIVANLDAKDFGVGWPSLTRLDFELELTPEKLDIRIWAKNVGEEKLPIGIGWHPYFLIPSGNRAQACLHLPAKSRLLVNNYDDVFPTGEIEAVANTPYDFRNKKPLANLFLDDCFTNLERTQDFVQAELSDPQSGCSLQMIACSPEINAFQVYSPVDQSFLALEPQFNLTDPFNPEIWPDESPKTGMVHLAPGESTQYHVQLKWVEASERG